MEKLVAVFREVRRVLRDDGTLWLNMGDCYGGSGNIIGDGVGGNKGKNKRLKEEYAKRTGGKTGLPGGNLMGGPWRVALALQEDGWILRQDIIWSKLSPMPESVRNRCTKSHEYIFLLTKRGSGYFYDVDAIREKSIRAGDFPGGDYAGRNVEDDNVNKGWLNKTGVPPNRNKRSVWNVASESYEGAHFATFPRKLITPCVLAGTSARGACVKCGSPWKRVTEEKKLKRDRPNDYVKRKPKMLVGRKSGIPGQPPQYAARHDRTSTCANTVAGVDVKTIGWEPTCTCNGSFERKRRIVRDKDGKRIVEYVQEYMPTIPLEEHPVEPCVVLDPFVGSGTTNVVAIANGLRSIGIDLSEDYLRHNAIPRIEGELLSRPALAALVSRKIEAVEVGEDVLED